jgi:peptidoglycan/xylan/chitin deacetylase (PgdA/CDA1 family)
LPEEAREEEIRGSRADLEARLGGPVRAFAYPYGLFDEAAVRAAEQAGFDAACSAHSGANGPAVPAFLLRRLEIRGTDTLLGFALVLWRRSRRRHRRER